MMEEKIQPENENQLLAEIENLKNKIKELENQVKKLQDILYRDEDYCGKELYENFVRALENLFKDYMVSSDQDVIGVTRRLWQEHQDTTHKLEKTKIVLKEFVINKHVIQDCLSDTIEQAEHLLLEI